MTDEQRAETVRRVAENLASMAFTSGVEMSDSGAQELAVTLEKKAYNVARVESTTTTGVRPASESLKSYTRYFYKIMFHHPSNIWTHHMVPSGRVLFVGMAVGLHGSN